MKHFTSRILMISPDKFRNNELTISDNSFQSRVSENISISDRAISEFERLKESISNRGVNVHAISDDSEFDTPDAVFPNNWISFHHSNRAVLYPMSALNRRFERKSSALKKLSDQGIKIDIIKDYSHFEKDDKYFTTGLKSEEGKTRIRFDEDPVKLSDVFVEPKTDELIDEAIHRGKKVKLNSPFRTPRGPKKFSVYVKTPKGTIKKVSFGDPNLRIKNANKKRAKSFRARHKCDQKKDRTTAGYWSCNVGRFAKKLGLKSSSSW